MDNNKVVQNYSILEVEELLANLHKNDFVVIKKHLDILGCGSLTGVSSMDLVHDVIIKTLEGDRNWPKGLKATKFLINTCRSEISNRVTKKKLEIFSENDNAIEYDSINYFDVVLSQSPNSKSKYLNHRLFVENKMKEVLLLFENDQIAIDIIEYKLEGFKKQKILDISGLTEKEYLNTYKRIRDKVNKRFPKGVFWMESKL